MKVDLAKSWGWGTTKEVRSFWNNMEFLFPGTSIFIATKQSSKDLGCMMQYTRKVTLGCF